MTFIKKHIKKLIWTTIVLLILSYIFTEYKFKSSFIDTEYIEIRGTNNQLIKTPYFNIKTPSHWVYLDKGMGMDSFNGSFWTGKGFLQYDLGSYGSRYDSLHCAIYGLEFNRDTIDGYIVNMGKDKWGMGFYIEGIPISFYSWFFDVDYKEISKGLIRNNKW